MFFFWCFGAMFGGIWGYFGRLLESKNVENYKKAKNPSTILKQTFLKKLFNREFRINSKGNPPWVLQARKNRNFREKRVNL